MGLDPKWTATVDDGLKNDDWDEYDQIIEREVDDYNHRFAHLPPYVQVDGKIFKAILWVESGGPSSTEWKGRVMQIGNPGDPAYQTLKAGKEGSSLIMRSQLWTDLKTQSISKPELNIKAGIAYVFTRMAQFADTSVEDPKDKTQHQYTVVSGDSLWKIANKVGTTVELLQAMNPKALAMIHPGQVLVYKKASMKMTIVGWRSFTPANIFTYYNGGGDPQYADKLNYVLELFKKLQR